MDNKLSALSKPTACRNKHTGRTFNATENTEPQIYESLYSQEYVSTLIQRAERIDSMLTESVQALKAAEQRIAELEAIRADASQVFKEIGNELGCNPDNESIMMAIDALKERERRVVALAGGNAELWETMAARLEAAEKRLATPVRLPDALIPAVHASGEPFMRPEPFGFYLNRDDVIKKLRAAGFTVEGDE